MRRIIFVAMAFVVLPVAALAQERPRLPQGPPGTVTLPVGDYDRLVDRVAQPAKRAAVAPVAAIISRADLRARVTADGARGTLGLDGETFWRGHVKVPFVSGATLLDARAGGRPLPLVKEGERHVAILPGPAAFSVTLEWAVPLASSPGRASFTLPMPSAATTSATIDLPGDPADVRVEPGVITRRESSAGRTIVEVTVQAGRPAQVSWSVRETATEAPVATRTIADVKSLITIGDADLRLVSLLDITVVRGDPRTFDIRLPAGFEIASVSGTSLESDERRDAGLTLTVRDASRRRHQFLIALERSRGDGSFEVETSFPMVQGAQRESGEAAIEATGTVEVSASGDEGLRRMDVREAHASLKGLARQPLLAAFRYQRRPTEARVMTVSVTRFSDAPVIAAAAERAVATTLVTVEGRMLTEVQLTLRNRAQQFIKVALPPGASIVSVEVAGETARPVTGTDATRVPLLRPGFKPDGPYTVSFVYLHAGQAFEKRGDATMILPAMDLPVSVLDWELFLPDRFSAKPSDGNVLPAHLFGDLSHAFGYSMSGGAAAGRASGVGPGAAGGRAGGSYSSRVIVPGQVIGRITDASNAALPGVTVSVQGRTGGEQRTVTDANGFYVLHGVPSGSVRVRAELAGFRTMEQSFTFDQRPRQLDFQLAIGGIEETVTVQAEARLVDPRGQLQVPQQEGMEQAPSANVLNLQRRVAGVLPVRVDVPRTGIAYRFVRPLVLDEQTTVTLRYKRRS